MTLSLVVMRLQVSDSEFDFRNGVTHPLASIYNPPSEYGIATLLPEGLILQEICTNSRLTKYIGIAPDNDETRWFAKQLSDYYYNISNTSVYDYYGPDYWLDDEDNMEDLIRLLEYMGYDTGISDIPNINDIGDNGTITFSNNGASVNTLQTRLNDTTINDYFDSTNTSNSDRNEVYNEYNISGNDSLLILVNAISQDEFNQSFNQVVTTQTGNNITNGSTSINVAELYTIATGDNAANVTAVELFSALNNSALVGIIEGTFNTSLTAAIAENIPGLYGRFEDALYNISKQYNFTEVPSQPKCLEKRHNFSEIFMWFRSDQEMENYMAHGDYGHSEKERPELANGIVIEEITNETLQYTIRFDSDIGGESKAIPDTSAPYFGNFKSNPLPLFINAYQYGSSGFLAWQIAIEQTFLRHLDYDTAKETKIGLHMFPIDDYAYTTFWDYVGDLLPIILMLSFSYPFVVISKTFVEEKAAKVKEHYGVLGGSNTAFLLSYMIAYSVTFTLCNLMLTFVLWISIFVNSEFSVLFVGVELFGLCMISFALVVGIVFDEPRTTALVACMIFICLFFLYRFVLTSPDESAKNMICLSGPAAFAMALNQIVDFESREIGVSWDNIDTLNDNFRLSSAYKYLFIDLVVYTVLVFYLDRVFPTKHGCRRPWYSPFSFMDAWYDKIDCLRYKRGRDDIKRYLSQSIVKQNTVNHENVDEILLGTPLLELMDLTKTFASDTKKKKVNVAVRKLCVKMYKGQVFCLLGHNGAGKSTTCNMLTGMLPINSGDAFVSDGQGNEYSIKENLNDVRKMTGLCPQHDILFATLTVWEHLQFYGQLKGMKTGPELDAICMELLTDIDMIDKIHFWASSLSGGQQRKLSVCIAMIGKNRLVILDEPTTGMDPYARRATWGFVRKYKKNRCIILTTHYMDEAEILSDRIGIMADGQMMCCGSSFYLKQQYNVGYALNVSMTSSVVSDIARVRNVIKKECQNDDVQLIDRNAKELLFRISFEANPHLPTLFRYFDANKKELCVDKYSISATTLEEVFRSTNGVHEHNKNKSIHQTKLSQMMMGSNMNFTISQDCVIASEGEFDFSVEDGNGDNSPRSKRVGLELGGIAEMKDEQSNWNETGGKAQRTKFTETNELDAISDDDGGFGSDLDSGEGGDGDTNETGNENVMVVPPNPKMQTANTEILESLYDEAVIAVEKQQSIIPPTVDTPDNDDTTSTYAMIGEKEKASTLANLGALISDNNDTMRVHGSDDNIISQVVPLKAPQPSATVYSSFQDSVDPGQYEMSGMIDNTSASVTDIRKLGTDYAFSEMVAPKLSRPLTLMNGFKPASTNDVFKDTYAETAHKRSGIPCFNLYFWAHILVQIWKRMLNAKRDKKTFWCQFAVPSVCIIFGLATFTVSWIDDPPVLYFDTDQLVDQNPYISKGMLPIPYTRWNQTTRKSYYQTDEFLEVLEDNEMDTLSNEYYGYVTTPYQSMNYTLPNWQYELLRTAEHNDSSRFVSLFFSQFLDIKVVIVGFNSTAYHGLPTAFNLGSQLIAQSIAPNAQIRGASHPFNGIASASDSIEGAGEVVDKFLSAVVVTMGMIFVPAAYIALLVDERLLMVKHQQLVSGMDILSYWIGNYMFDFLCNIIPSVFCILYLLMFSVKEFLYDEAWLATLFTLILFGWSIVPFTYLFSMFFKSAGSAQSLVVFFYFGTSVILMCVMWIMATVSGLEDISEVVGWICRIFPSFCLAENLRTIALRENNLIGQGRSDDTLDVWDFEVSTRNMCIMIFEGILYFGLLLAVEYFQESSTLLSCLKKANDVDDDDGDDGDMDQDVIDERNRIIMQSDDKNDINDNLNVFQRYASLKPAGDDDNQFKPVEVRGLRKVYPGNSHRAPLVAVKNLWYSVAKGEVFGFLGLNGAGKTTTLSMLSGVHSPTGGNAFINGYPISDQVSVRLSLGYCPQFSALFPRLTVREHLEFFARIKGISNKNGQRDVLIDSLIKDLALAGYDDRLSSQLSGGNQRKVSIGIALIGNPPVVILDEPTAGMDPISRRSLWDFIQSTMQGRSVILTTHSMEECEALCDRIGIMIKGQLACIGKKLHLKQKFGGGFQVDIKFDIAYELKSLSPVAENDDNGTKMIRIPDASPAGSVEMQTMSEMKLEMEPIQRTKSGMDYVSKCTPKLMKVFGDDQVNLKENYSNTARYQIGNDKMSIADVFEKMESIKLMCNIADYAVSETTLEQIFLKFANAQAEKEANNKKVVNDERSSCSKVMAGVAGCCVVD